jgi:hypothetical protein
MVVSVSKLLKKIDDLRSAAVEARSFAEHMNPDERQSILKLADDWEARATKEEDRVVRYSMEAETP